MYSPSSKTVLHQRTNSPLESSDRCSSRHSLPHLTADTEGAAASGGSAAAGLAACCRAAKSPLVQAAVVNPRAHLKRKVKMGLHEADTTKLSFSDKRTAAVIPP